MNLVCDPTMVQIISTDISQSGRLSHMMSDILIASGELGMRSVGINASVKLPQKDMLIKYHSKSSEMYLTSRGPLKKDRGKGKSMLDSLAAPFIESVSVLRDEHGMVCSRKKKGLPWQTNLIGSAIQVDDNFINQYQSA